MDELKQERLNKYIAQCGLCSRRDADKLIGDGRVFVNGERAAVGTRVSGRDQITVNGKMVAGKDKPAVLAYYKPVGVTCTERDKHAKRLVGDDLAYPVRLTYAGRLDQDSEGLLIMTNDGDLIEGMMRGANGHEKEYVVKVNREITPLFLQEMGEGIYLEELKTRTRPCLLTQEGKYTFRIILTQGLNRQIRRMVQALGYEVKALKRVRVLNVCLEDLKPGEYRVLEGEPLRQLYESCGNRKRK